jgi:hypothetical protein
MQPPQPSGDISPIPRETAFYFNDTIARSILLRP